jgi:hypothetical protein
MPFQRLTHPRSVPAGVLAAAGLMLAAAGCGAVTPLGPDPTPVSLPPARDLASPIIMQVLRSQPPTSAGQCPTGSVALYGSEPNVPRAALASSVAVPVQGSTAPPAPATPPAPGAGVACYLPVGEPVTVTSASITAVTSYPQQSGPTAYGFVVAFPTTDIAALTAAINQAYASGDALGMTVAGKLWQAPPTQHKANALRAEQVNLLSKDQAQQLYRLLDPTG